MRFVELQEVYYRSGNFTYDIRPMTCNLDEISNVTKITASNPDGVNAVITMKNGKTYRVRNQYKDIMKMLEDDNLSSEEEVESLAKAIKMIRTEEKVEVKKS